MRTRLSTITAFNGHKTLQPKVTIFTKEYHGISLHGFSGRRAIKTGRVAWALDYCI